MLIDTFTQNNRKVYVYGKKSVLTNRQVPMILDLNCTTGNPKAEVLTNGWDEVTEKENIIVIAPEYDDYATYSECPFLRDLIAVCVQKYPIDESRIYSVGFSNGGASSVALASTYPNLLAGIAAMGWAIGMMRSKTQIPFLLIQGSKEYVDQNLPAVMDDEKETLRDIFLADNLITNEMRTDYKKWPYWGYPSSSQEVKELTYHDYDPYGNMKQKVTNNLTFSYYQKNGYRHPFVQTVLIPNAHHIPHDCNAEIAWDFLKHFARDKQGQIVEINN
ncbi:hypothetical protein FC39_GL001268 [Lactobacillus hamsteri DSM 5661 = JCM 6256]|uniref:Uncharacterized protein n=3 Tax=Lactobacillus hamsteri TaxID=96565 RepID=A0A0R1Y7X2_9LACO|nr:hypothetical protein FC39_GL001268 [Lactobacillus hamsteri DSM 5661 = JCM 6256]